MKRRCMTCWTGVIAIASIGGCRSGGAESPQSGDRAAGGEAPAATASAEAWYEPEIRAFEAADRATPPVPGRVVFVGSSSIRMWRTLAADMEPVPVVNRGFGGSKTGEVLEVFDRVVTPQRPAVIVYYCGDNDLGTDNTDSEAAAAGFIEFDRRARRAWPRVRVLYIAIKPSLARWENWGAMGRANDLVRAYCARTPGAEFLDIATPMLGADGRPEPSLFESDGLHVNAKGYEVWTGVVRPRVLAAWREVGAR
ncbi:MAG: GDSL-type esterase/lipase family protein [Planctomycetota bacterium]|nr:GDSL-type esterase/lipase family protein [Planctomycetota bacterium]